MAVLLPNALVATAQVGSPNPEHRRLLGTSPALMAPDPIAHFYTFGLGLGLGTLGAISWKFSQTWTGDFVTSQEGWFASDTYAGGADKIGHFYTDFVLVRALHEIYSRHHYQPQDALWYSVVAATIIRSAMEVADGFTSFKFSPQDLIANLAGTATSALLLSHPQWDEVFAFSWTYLPSREKLEGKVAWSSIDNDYNGSIYHLDIRLKGLRPWIGTLAKTNFDPYSIGLSYHTRGYDRPRDHKQRFIGVHMGLNIEELLRTHTGNDSLAYSSRPVLRYFKLPFTFGGLTYDLDHNRFGLRYGLNYFY